MTTQAEVRAPAIEFRGVDKSFGRVHVVKSIDLEIREGEFFSLLGPSGCGKTTSLRMMAGFEEPDLGQILLRGQDVTNVPANKRNVNMVFQNYELFPHMTVFDNVAYGLKLKKVPQAEIRQRVMDMLGVVRVDGLEGRGARQLSGGQQQRVALARALVNRPAVLLLDEPLSALDVKLRKQMQLELKAIQHRLGTTFVYVTHDQEEALLMSDRVGIMNHGRILQIGTPRQIYSHPADAFVADFVGSLNVLRLSPDEVSAGFAVARPTPAERLIVPVGDPGVRAGTQIQVAIRPERILLDPTRAPGPPDSSRLEGTIAAVDYAGPTTQYRVDNPAFGTIICHRVNETSAPDLEVGRSVVLTWPPDASFVIPEPEQP